MSYLLEEEVEADLHRDGCPACRASQRAGRAWVRELIAQQMTDSLVLELVEKAGGLCPVHLLLGVEVAESDADTLGLDLFAEYVLRLSRRHLPDAAAPRRTRRRSGLWRRTVRGGQHCLACEAEERRAIAYIDILADLAARHDSRLKCGWQLCFPHLLVAIGRLEDDVFRGRLVDSVHHRADLLERELATEIRRHSHDRRRLGPAPDPALAAQTVRWLAGRAESPLGEGRSAQ